MLYTERGDLIYRALAIEVGTQAQAALLLYCYTILNYVNYHMNAFSILITIILTGIDVALAA